MGRIMSINAMTGSAGRVIGPIIFGYLYGVNIRFPYRLAAVFTTLAAALYLLTDQLNASLHRRPRPLADADSAAKRPSSALSSSQKLALDELMNSLRTTIIVRGYDLANPTVVELLADIMNSSLPEKVNGRSDEELLHEEAEFVQSNREQWSHHHPHA